ncbi:hypothetical protein C900_05439 [Fulvivirga imtechensis AK7]|uniref:HTH cro/C1-type domain-containing protein n=1 Tax=Fulvivirga imtechensis AK7 TaxID=1237149 RepID=L8JJR8_9BACT|nr:helix-turn-helix transcriptional regulator [Fulvivirga imtechensis]ELR69050.1 hypothetical protein C900_05439 [Fulvivirga imtechensis AK7]
MSKKKFLGEKIAAHRDKLKLNRQEFINKLNELLGTSYSAQALYSWEKGKSIPPADLVPPLANLLEMNMLELFGIDASEIENMARDNAEHILEIQKLRKKVEAQEREIQRLGGKLEATESFMDKLVSKLRNSEELGS